MHTEPLKHPVAPAHASQPGTIVVGVVGSAASRQALRLAAEQAAQTGQTIRAVLVRHYPVRPCGRTHMGPHR